MKRNADLNRHTNALALQNLDLSRTVVQFEEKIEKLTLDRIDAEDFIADMGEKLSNCIQTQSVHLKRERNMQHELRKVKRELGQIREVGPGPIHQ